MDDKQIAAILQRAAEIVKTVEPDLKNSAFQAAVDLLMAGDVGLGHPSKAQTMSTTKTPKTTHAKAEDTDTFDEIATSINRSEHPEVFQEKRVLERALRVLKIAQDRGHEYLTTQQISKVLTERFRLATTYQAVRFALESAPTFTNSKQAGRSTVYAIMHPGDQHLALPEAERTGAQFKRPSAKSVHKSRPQKEGDVKVKAKRANGSTGPKGLILQLVQEDFFAPPKTIGELRDHLKDKKGHAFATADLSTPLLRLLRDKVLNRITNPEGQYVYEAHKS